MLLSGAFSKQERSGNRKLSELVLEIKLLCGQRSRKAFNQDGVFFRNAFMVHHRDNAFMDQYSANNESASLRSQLSKKWRLHAKHTLYINCIYPVIIAST